MNDVIGTCGHKLKGVDDNQLTIIGYDKDGERVLCYVCVCDKCAKEYDEADAVLRNKEEEDFWLSGEMEI